jgi:protein-L-isoaspartate(D-aspartate) O-methyltransferase
MRLSCVAAVVACMLAACSNREPTAQKKSEMKPAAAAPRDADAPKPLDPYAEARFDMVDRTIVARGITDERVIAAMKIAPRHEFVPPDVRAQAYDDRPLPIGFDLTISQPFIVATMTQAAKIKAGEKVLEIGTGSGYQAAVLALMGAKVTTIEIHPDLAARTEKVLAKLGFKDIKTVQGDGFYGWRDGAPYDAILITCATPEFPTPLLAQLKQGGRIVAPIGDTFEQELTVATKTADGLEREALMGVRFSSMKGEIDKQR